MAPRRIDPLVIERLLRGELTRRAQELAARHFDIPDSKRTAVAVDTLLDWAGRCRTGGQSEDNALSKCLRKRRYNVRLLNFPHKGR